MVKVWKFTISFVNGIFHKKMGKANTRVKT
jgi:hypothetical protein